MEYAIKLYYNSGFNKENIPDGIELLESASSSTVTISKPLYLYQDAVIATIRLETKFEDIAGVDYVVICGYGGYVDGEIVTSLEKPELRFYTVEDITMLNPEVAQLSLLIDPINSIAHKDGKFDNIEFVCGTLERCHSNANEEATSSANIFDFINTPEPFVPSNPVQVVKKYYTLKPDFKTVIPSYVDLVNLEAVASTYEDAVTGEKVTVPTLPLLQQGTTFSIIDLLDESVYQTGFDGLGLFEYNHSAVRSGLKFARALGLDTLILPPYNLPLSYSTCVNGMYTDLYYTIEETTLSRYTGYVYEPQFRKSLIHMSLFNFISLTSGESATYSAYEIADADGDIVVSVFIDGSPGGKSYCKPAYYLRARTSLLEKAISSTQWNSPGLAMETPSGSMNQILSNNITSMTNKLNTRIGLNQLDLAQARIDTTANMQQISNVLSLLTNPLGVTNIYNTEFDRYFNTQQNILGKESLKVNSELAAQNLRLQNAQIQMSGSIFSAPSFNSMNYIGPSFQITELNLSEMDLVRLDQFFCLYGYGMEIPARGQEARFKNRQVCNFIKTRGIKIKLNQIFEDDNATRRIPQYLIKLAETRLDAGVRVWHTDIKGYSSTNPPVV